MKSKQRIRAYNNLYRFTDRVNINTVKSYELDFGAWCEDNGSLVTAVFTTNSGQASITSQSLTSNIATALITFNQIGRNLIKLVGTAASGQVYVVYIDIVVYDPAIQTINDFPFSG